MRKDEWYAKARTFGSEARVKSAALENDLRAHLIEHCDLIELAPSSILQELSAIREADLIAVSTTAEARIRKGQPRVNVRVRATDREILIDLWGHIRALDRILFQDRRSFVTSRPMQDWRVSINDKETYLIPTMEPRRQPVRDNGSFRHRALLYHRKIPAQIGEFAVALYTQPGRIKRNNLATYAAVFFPDLKLVEGDEKGKIRILDVECPSYDALIEKSLSRAHTEQRNILIFPELTINPRALQNIQASLATRPWQGIGDSINWSMSLVMAGSWHTEIDGTTFNIATILDGYGRPLAFHKKLFPYFDKGEVALEAIEPGTTISILVLDDALIAFGVCRDFCERIIPDTNPYTLMDVDLVLVTSFGNPRTLEGHQSTARDVKTRFETLSFVVQQAYPQSKDALGYVLSPTDDLPTGKKWADPWFMAP